MRIVALMRGLMVLRGVDGIHGCGAGATIAMSGVGVRGVQRRRRRFQEPGQSRQQWTANDGMIPLSHDQNLTSQPQSASLLRLPPPVIPPILPALPLPPPPPPAPSFPFPLAIPRLLRPDLDLGHFARFEVDGYAQDDGRALFGAEFEVEGDGGGGVGVGEVDVAVV